MRSFKVGDLVEYVHCYEPNNIKYKYWGRVSSILSGVNFEYVVDRTEPETVPDQFYANEEDLRPLSNFKSICKEIMK